MDALVNYISDDEPEEIMDNTTAQRSNRGVSPGKSRHSYGNEMSMRTQRSSEGDRRDTPPARNNNFRDESSQRQKTNSYGSNNRSETSTYHSRDRDSRDNRDGWESTRDRRDNRRESRDNTRSNSRDERERDREKDKRYSSKDSTRNDYKNDRTRSRDNKSDYSRERDNTDNSRRPPPPRDDERQGRPSSPSSYKSNRYSGNGRAERTRYDSSSSTAATSSSFRAPHQHNRSYDQRHSDRDRNERRSTDRTSSRSRRRSNSPSPSPQSNQRHSYPHKRSTHTDKSHSRQRTRSRSRSTTPKRRSMSRERSDRESYALEQARKSALEMERKIQTDDQDSGVSQTYTSTSSSQISYRSHTQPLLSLPLSETAPKQPNVIAVTPASSSAEPALIQLPSYYNPNVINPNRYAEQVQKRKLLWGAKKTEDTAKKWGNAQFSQDTDGRVASKFMRLMGIKGSVPPSKEESAEEEQKAVPSVAPDVKTRQVMFSNMEQQYEVARQVTHTMRGVGLGFSSQARQF